MNLVFKIGVRAAAAALAAGALAAATVVGSGGCAPSDDDALTEQTPLEKHKCASCHGPEGSGTENGPTIVDPVPAYARFVTRTGRDDLDFELPMAAFGVGDLSEPAMDEVLAYLASRPRVTTGQDLYLRYCGNCHGADALGGRSEEDLAGEADDAAHWRSKVRTGMGQDMAARTKYMPSWTAEGLTDSEIEAIRGYVSTLPGGGPSTTSSSSGAPSDDDDDD